MGLDAADRLLDAFQMNPRFVAVHEGLVAGLDAQRNLQTTGRLEHPQQIVVGMAHPHGTVELNPQVVEQVIQQQAGAFIDGLGREQAPGGVEGQFVTEQGVVEDDVAAQALDACARSARPGH